MTKIKKSTIITLLATAVLGTSAITANFNTTASAAKTEKVSHRKTSKKHIKKAAKKPATNKQTLAKQKAEQKKINEGWKKANAAADKRVFGNGKSNQTHKKADKIIDGYDTVTHKITDETTYINTVKSQYLTQINELRAQKGVAPVSIGNLQQVADTRAQQVLTNFDHYDSNGKILANEISVSDGIYNSYNDASEHISENLGSELIDEPDIVAKNNMTDTIAEEPNGGHYLTTINPQNKTVNIGVSISNNVNNPDDQIVNIVEDYVE